MPVVGLMLLVTVASAALAAQRGGADIASAPLIEPGQRVEGNLAPLPDSGNGWKTEYFRLRLQAGDHVALRAESVGDVVPCAGFFLPGTDDYNLSVDRLVQGVKYTESTYKRTFATFTAGSSGIYVLAMKNYASYGDAICGGYGGSTSERWAYSLTALAPHALRLALPSLKHLRNDEKLDVSVVGALGEPVTHGLSVRLFGVWGTSKKPKLLSQSAVRNGKARFVLHLPKSVLGKKGRLLAAAGDDQSWVSVRIGRSYRLEQ
jgi:hypothetical protein